MSNYDQQRHSLMQFTVEAEITIMKSFIKKSGKNLIKAEIIKCLKAKLLTLP